MIVAFFCRHRHRGTCCGGCDGAVMGGWKMIEVKIQDYVGTKKELTAEQVRKLPVGTKVLLHSFDRHGEHHWMEMKIVNSGKKKILIANDFYGNKIIKTIRKESGRFCYTEV